MNLVYRIVWNAVRQCLMVVAENARTHGKAHASRSSVSLRNTTKPGHQLKAISLALAAIGMYMNSAVFAQVVPATTVLPVGGNTNAYISPNGVPVVNINTANAAGVSHNQYSKFNVEANGLVLNNGNTSQSARQSALAGQVVGNINLAAEAKVIINEVVSPNRSTLAGFIEVLGSRADVIVANPYGITCSGCGFLNSDRVTMTTGTPNFGPDGGLLGFSVNRGDILIQGDGLNASAQQILDLVTRSVRIDGKINTAASGELGITTGNNVWNYNSRTVTGSTTPTDAQPSYAIDSTVLGGMYSGRIRLIATEAGVGVRMLGDAAASVDNFSLQSNGHIDIRSQISAAQDVTLNTVSADANALLLQDGTVSATRNLALTSTGGAQLTNQTLYAKNDLIGSFAALTIDPAQGSTVYSDHNLALTTTSGDMVLNNGSLRSAVDMALTALNGKIITTANSSQGIQSTGGNLSLTAANGITNAGIMTADQGNLTLQNGVALNNSGTLNAGHTLSASGIGAVNTEAISNTGTMLSGADLNLSGAAIANSSTGKIQASGGALLTGTAVSNDGTLILSATGSKNGIITAAALTNNGTLQSAGNLTVQTTGATLNNAAAILLATSQLTLGAASLTNHGQLSANTLGLTLGSLYNDGTLQGGSGNATATVSGSVTNALNGKLVWTTGSAALSTLSAANVSNDGTIQSAGNQTLSIAANGLLNNTGTMLSGGDLNINGQGGLYSVNDSGRLQAASAMHITGYNSGNQVSVTLAGTAVALSNMLDIEAQSLTLNNGAFISSTGAGTLHLGTLSLGGTTSRIVLNTLGDSTSTLAVAGAISNPGVLHASGNFNVSASSLTNQTTGGISSLNTLGLTTTGAFTNSGALYAASALNVTAGGTLTNTAYSSGSSSVVQGTMDSNGSISLTAPAIVNNSMINALGNITISTPSFTNQVAGGDQREWYTSAQNLNQYVSTDSYYSFPDDYKKEYYQSTKTLSQRYVGGAPAFKPQIVSGGTLSISNFNTGLNFGGVISGNTVNISGNGGSTFTNDAYTLIFQDYKETWYYYTHYAALGPATYDDHVLTGDTGFYQTNTGEISNIGAGIRAQTLNASGFNLVNLGSAYAASTATRSASGASQQAAGQISTINGAHTVSFGGLNITLPTNPNGYFITTQSASAAYLVETNPLFSVGSNFVGSDYLSVRYGYNPDVLVKRLGDANYEAYLIQQQIVAATGSTLLAGSASEAGQIQSLMDNALAEGKDLGLTYGVAPTAAQLAGIKQDMVWMVQTVVDGQTVLAPVVYLAQSTRDSVTSGAVITANNATMNLASVTNTGGTIQGTQSLAITSQNDITNTSGTITGGDVSLKSVNGSIVNQTASTGAGNSEDYSTTIGKTAGISSTGNLALDAARDITVTGATVSAGGDASLTAGNNVTFDTIQDKTTRTTRSSSGSGMNTSDNTTTIGTVQQVKSGLTTGGNLAVKSGNDITLAGTDVNVTGNGSLDAANALNIVARDNTTTTHSESRTAGIGVGGGVYGTSSTTTDALSSRNVASNLNIGGDATLTSGGTTTLQGSNLNVGGDATINAADVQVLAGHDFDQSHTVTETTSFLKVGASGDTAAGAGASAGAGADASAASSSSKTGGTASASASASANAQAGASASANGNAGLTLAETTTTEQDRLKSNSVGSNINVGNNLTINSNKSITLQGASVAAGNDVNLNATDINVMAAQNIDTSHTSTRTTSVGFFIDSKNNASADASAGADASANSQAANRTSGSSASADASASAQAQANAQASSDSTIDLLRTSTTTTDALNITNTGSTIKAGGSLNANAKNTLTVQGSDLSGDKGVSVSATDINFLAAQDVSQTTTSTTRSSAGLYVSGNAQAGVSGQAGGSVAANAQSGMGGTGAGGSFDGSASVDANASAKAGIGLQFSTTSENSSSGSSTARVSSITSGSGDITRTATNKITDVGTTIDAAGDFNQSATTIDSQAARNTSYSTSSSETNTARFGVYAQANADAGASASASGSAGGSSLTGLSNVTSSDAKAGASANASVGVEASYTNQKDSSASNTSDAVVSTIKAGGKVNSTSTGKTSLEGTQISSGGDTSLSASSLDFKAAQSTASSSQSSGTVNAAANIGLNLGTSGEVEGGVSGGYNSASGNSASSTATAGSIQSGGNLTIKTAGDANFEGTSLSSGGDASIAAGGNVNMTAARNTASDNSTTIDAQASVGIGKGGKNGGSVDLAASGGYGNEKSSSSDAVTGSVAAGGNLTIQAGKNASFEGTSLAAGNDATVGANGAVTMSAAQNTASAEKTDVSASLGIGSSNEKNASTGAASSSKSGSLSADGSYSKDTSSTAVAGSISGGNNVAIRSGGDTTLEGTAVSAGNAAAVDAGGNLNLKAATSTSESVGVSAGIDLSGSNKTTNNSGVAGASTPAAGGAAAKAAGVTTKPVTAASTAENGTEKERSGEASLAVSAGNATDKSAVTISSGNGGVSLSAGKDATLEGTKVGTTGDIAVNAGGNVNMTTATSSTNAVGVSLGGGADSSTSTADPSKNESKKTGNASLDVGVTRTNDGASLQSGGTVTVNSGGQTTLTNTGIAAGSGSTINAAGGITKNNVGDTDIAIGVSKAVQTKSPEPASPNKPVAKE